MPVGEHVVVSGRMEWFNGRPTMVHPDHIAPLARRDDLPLVEPVYPLTAGLSAKVLRRAIGQALARLPALPEWLDPARRRDGSSFPAFARSAVSACTIPPTRSTFRPKARPGAGSPMTSSWPASSRWRWCARERPPAVRAGRSPATGGIAGAIRAALPYSLTGIAGTRARRDRRRPGRARAHAAAAAGRCRLRQDGRGAAGHGARGRRPAARRR